MKVVEGRELPSIGGLHDFEVDELKEDKPFCRVCHKEVDYVSQLAGLSRREGEWPGL